MQCEILYNRNKIGTLKSSVVVYLKTKNFDIFKSKFLKGKFPTETRFNLEYSDDLEDVHKSVIAFYNDIWTIANNEIASNPDNIPAITKLISLIETEFHIDTDHTQSVSNKSDNEVKTANELYDKNRNNLLEHLKEIYGEESYDIRMSLD